MHDHLQEHVQFWLDVQSVRLADHQRVKGHTCLQCAWSGTGVRLCVEYSDV